MCDANVTDVCVFDGDDQGGNDELGTCSRVAPESQTVISRFKGH